MKLILFSDLHRDKAAAARIVELARDADVVIGAGDFASVRHDPASCIDVLAGIRIPAVLVSGNNESHDELVAACKNWKSARILHGTSVEIAGVTFFGLGGGVPVTPFGSWSWDFSEDDAAQLLQKCPRGAVLISHSPPKGFVDEDGSSRSRGSTAVLDAITRVQPPLVVCGHIHASAGQRAKLGPTTIINAGSGGITFELRSSVK
jgi:uncharacterized protein